MTMTKDDVQARIAKMIPGGLLLEFMSYNGIVELLTVAKISPTFASMRSRNGGN